MDSINDNIEENLDDKKCPECGEKVVYDGYCKPCNSEHFRGNFTCWTSDDSKLNELIQNSQLNANCQWEVIEWIDYSTLEDVEYVAKGGFGNVYKAIWKDGPIDRYEQAWDVNESKWQRESEKKVAVKEFRNVTSVGPKFLKFLKEVEINLKINEASYAFETIQIYGVTRVPKSEEYAIVMEFQEDGNLREMIKKHHSSLTWEIIIRMLWKISYGLHCIHEEKYCHKDFHSGNILCNYVTPVISDFGLCGPLDQSNSNNGLYGVLPFVAPEILHKKEFTTAADIYGFGMIMLEIISGVPPFADIELEEQLLSIYICDGHRPQIPRYTPEPYATLMKRCWDTVPNNRPTAWELREQFLDWLNVVGSLDNPDVELSKDRQLATRQEIEEEFSQERENMWKARLAEAVISTSKESQRSFISKRLEYSESSSLIFNFEDLSESK